MSEVTGDIFQPVESRRKRKKRQAGLAAIPQSAVSFRARVEKAKEEFGDTEWMKDSQKKIETSFETLGWTPSNVFVLCLGLGSPMGSKIAAVQLGFIASICDCFGIVHSSISFFDPHFSKEDIQGLLAMGFCVLTENRHGNYPLKNTTLLFMPHCGLELYENVLRENWHADTLRNFLLLGNILQEYVTATPKWKFEQRTPCISRIWKYICCDPIARLDADPFAFFSLGLQYVDVDALPSPEDPMWNLPTPVADEKFSAEIT